MLKSFIRIIGLFFVVCVFGNALAGDARLFDLKQVADQPMPDVEKILGKPSRLVDDVFRGSRGYTYPAIRAGYRNGAIEITYLEGGARYLTVWVQKLSDKYPAYFYPKDGWTLLGDLGLDRNTPADFSNQAITRWRDLPGIYKIDVFPNGEKKISSVHVLINRIYE